MTHPQNNETNTPQGGRDDPDRRDAPARVPSDLDLDQIDGQRDKHGGQQGDVQQPGQNPDQNPDGGQGGKDKQDWDKR